MGRSRPTIRPALPEDSAFIAHNILFLQRGPLPRGWFESRWIGPNRNVSRLSSGSPPRAGHPGGMFRIFIVAEVDGQPAASLCAMPAAGTGPAARAAIEEVAGETGLSAAELAAIFHRGAYTRNCWVQGGDGDWLIEHVATLPDYRGRGLVSDLIDYALAAGKAAGFKQASISFLIGNAPAERSYAKAGFAFAEEKRDPAFEALTGVPGFRRFARAIKSPGRRRIGTSRTLHPATVLRYKGLSLCIGISIRLGITMASAARRSASALCNVAARLTRSAAHRLMPLRRRARVRHFSARG